MSAIVSIRDLSKVYDSGFEALKSVSLDIEEGEILALLGPNGAGKTTLISTICGIVMPTSGAISVAGFDTVKDYRKTRAMIGLVPQEVALEPFEKVINTVTFSRGLFGKRDNPAHVENVLKQLSLWDKRKSPNSQLSGGMKRRVLIAKALAHEPTVLFLDEPTAGVDVELRKGMWDVVRDLKAAGATIILTTHYIEEAEALADRVAVINDGRILLVEDKATLMRRMGKKTMTVELTAPITGIPEALSAFDLDLGGDGTRLVYTYDGEAERTGITRLLAALPEAGLKLRDVQTKQASLEDIFVDLVRESQ
jgi:ABC-2 type transport system ATP-binding protein